VVAGGGNEGVGLQRPLLHVLHKGAQQVGGVVVAVQVQQQRVGAGFALPLRHVARHALVVGGQVVRRVVGAGQHKHENRLVGRLGGQALVAGTWNT
jgi:hypothetical protein